MSTKYVNERGQAITVGARIAGGGEGDILEVVGRATMVAKVFHPPKPGEQVRHFVKQAKVRAMVMSKPIDRVDGRFVVLAWPEELLLNPQREVAGFLMPKLELSSSIELHNLTNASDRVELTGHPTRGWVGVFTYSHLINVARNLIRAVRVVHRGNQGGHGVIGDFNESNVLVWNTTGVTLVDCDSMQFSLGGTDYLTTVLKPDYSAPEILDGTVDIRTDVRSVETDLYVLALHIYTLLMDGSSPFGRGLWKGTGPRPDRATLMKHGDWAGGKSRKFVTAPACPPIEILPTKIRNVFEQTFGPAGARTPVKRATCDQWDDALEELAQQLNKCRANKLHQWPNGLSNCPWCALEQRTTTQTHFVAPNPPPLRTRPRTATPTNAPVGPRRPPLSPAAAPVGPIAPPWSGPAPTQVPRFSDLFRGRERVGVVQRATAATLSAAALGLLLFATTMLPRMFTEAIQASSPALSIAPVLSLWRFTPTAFLWGGAIACVGRRFLLVPVAAALHAIALGWPTNTRPSRIWELTTVQASYPPYSPWGALSGALNSVWPALPLLVFIAIVSGVGGMLLAVRRAPGTSPPAQAYNARIVDGMKKHFSMSRRDRSIAIVAVVLAVTGVVPWLIGFVMSDHWWQPRHQGVLDPSGRDGWIYFGVRYGSGLVVILTLLAAIWVLSGRWSDRMGTIAAAVVAVAVATLVLRPAVAQAWDAADTNTSNQQRSTKKAIPKNLLCAAKSRSLTDPDTGLNSTWQAYIVKSGINTKCDRLAIYQGIRLAKQEELGNRTLQAKTLTITKSNSLAAAYVKVKDSRGMTRTYKLITLR